MTRTAAMIIGVVLAAQGEALAEVASSTVAQPKKEEPKLSLPKLGGYLMPLFAWVTEDGAPQSNFTARSSRTNFLLKRARVRLTGEIFMPELTYTFMVDPLAPATNKIVRDGFIAYTPFKPYLEIRAGQFRVPFGWENWTSFVVLPLIERAMVNDLLVRGLDTRDLGLAVLGSIPIIAELAIEYRAAIVNDSGGGITDPIPRKDPYGRLGLAWGKIAKLGFSAGSRRILTTGMTPARETSVLIGADLQVDWGPVFFAAEFARGMHSEPADLDRMGFHVTLLGRTPWYLEGVVRYEQYWPNQDRDELTRKRFTAGINFKPHSDNAKLMINYRHDGGEDQRSKASALLVQGVYAF